MNHISCCCHLVEYFFFVSSWLLLFYYFFFSTFFTQQFVKCRCLVFYSFVSVFFCCVRDILIRIVSWNCVFFISFCFVYFEYVNTKKKRFMIKYRTKKARKWKSALISVKSMSPIMLTPIQSINWRLVISFIFRLCHS